MTRETIDDTLDRVAREMTAVPADASFVARMEPRLDGSPRHGFGLRTIAVAACVLALAAAAVVRRGDSGTPQVVTVAPANERPRVPSVDGAQRESAATPGRERLTATSHVASAGASNGIAAAMEPSAIPALPPPSGLDVAHLSLDPLVVHPVDISGLEVSGLSFTDLGAAEEPKE